MKATLYSKLTNALRNWLRVGELAGGRARLAEIVRRSTNISATGGTKSVTKQQKPRPMRRGDGSIG
jgi:hypothetical protein